MASSSGNQEEEYIDHGFSFIKMYKNKKNRHVGSADHHQQKNTHPTSIDPTIEEERPPYIIVVHGPPKVGKTLLIKSLVDFYTKGNHPDMAGPIRILAGGKRRIQFVECPNNVNGMIDAAKYADAVIFLIDAGYGFEMETFEFLELLKVHGMPKVMGVLTYLDTFKNEDILANTRQRLLDQFQTELCRGAQVFCLSGLDNAMYLKHEIAKLATYISTMEFYPLSWRAARPYMLVDHFKDVTSQEAVQMDEECPRNIVFEGYLRGCHIEEGTKVHIAGFGDFPLASVTSLTDPFPLPPVDEVIPMGIEGFRAGTYVRFEFHDVPFEMVKNHDPCQPILVGRISLEEENVGYIQVRLERHSWHMKLLKTKDPIIVSVGWRRYQTRPVYALEDCNGSYRVLNYTPENIPCLAMFWGPLAPPGTGLAAVQSLADNKAAFRILAKASVLDFNQAAQIVKKCKRIGTPYKILKKTALIKDMFTSDLEIANFKNAIIQTTSGVHGKINKPAGKNHIRGLETKDGQPREGIAKCTFKRKIRKRDTIFMHVYEQVEVPRFFSPIMRGPEPPDRVWEGVVDTCGASDLPVAANIESFYKSHINPLEVKDLELHSRWSSVMQAEMLATSEEEILSVKRQKEDLKIACDERRREMEFLSRRRQTLEKLRAVHIIESQKKHRKTEKQSLISEKHLKLLKRLRKDVMKGFNEYEKGKKRTAR